MLSKIIDYYIDKKDIKKASLWVEWLRTQGRFLGKQYVKDASLVLFSQIFENVKKNKNKKKQNDILKELYENKKVPKKVRFNSSFQMALNYLNLNNSKDSLNWIYKSFFLLKRKDLLKHQHNILSSVVKMIELQDFKSAGRLSYDYFLKNCFRKYELKNDFYKAMILYPLMEGSNEIVFRNLKIGKRCKIKESIQSENLRYIAQVFLKYQQYESFDILRKIYGKKINLFTKLLLEYYWDSFVSGMEERQLFVLDRIGKNRYPKELKREIKAVFDLHGLKISLKRKNDFHFESDPFDEKKFNEKLNKYINDLNRLKNKIERYMASGYPHLIAFGSWILSKRYREFGKSLLNLKMTGVDEVYKKSFLREMKNIAAQFILESKKRKKELKSFVEKRNILFPMEIFSNEEKLSFYIIAGNKKTRRKM